MLRALVCLFLHLRGCVAVLEGIGHVLWEGVNVTRYLHTDKVGPGNKAGGTRVFEGEWSNPFNATHNTLCTISPAAPAAMRCPAQCSASARRVSRRRVRKAVGTMPEDEWQRVVKALWIMRTLTEEEGRRIYGRGYRGMAYFNLRHYTGAQPRPRNVSVTNADGSSRDEMQAQTDVTGGGAQTYTYHGLFSMELETALLVVDPDIPGLPYLDWTDPVNTARRLGVARAAMPLQYNCLAWKTSCTETAPAGLRGAEDAQCSAALDLVVHRGGGTLGVCLERREAEGRGGCCVLAALGDGDFAWWPVPQFDITSFCDSSTPAVQELLCTPRQRAAVATVVAANRGQLRPDTSGPAGRLYNNETSGNTSAYDGPIPYVLRYDGGYEAYVTQQTETWARAVATCVGLGGLYTDASECIEGRMAVNNFSIHLELHSVGGDMSLAMVPHDPLFLFHHNGLDRVRRQWQANNPQLRPMAYGYPLTATGYTAAFGTEVGLYDCLGCMAEGSGFTAELLLGTSDAELNALPLNTSWLTSADLLCVLDDIYTYDVLLEMEAEAEAEAGAADAGAVASTVLGGGQVVSLGALLGSTLALVICRGRRLGRLRSRRSAAMGAEREHASVALADENRRSSPVDGYDMRYNDAAIAEGSGRSSSPILPGKVV